MNEKFKLKKIDSSHSLGVVEKNSIDYIQAVFNALEEGLVIVPLRSVDDNMRIDAVGVKDVISPDEGGGWLQRALALSYSDDAAHISFTSGTEGLPKGVLMTHLALSDVVNRMQSLMLMDESVKEYIGVPVYHSFGYGRCRHVASIGGKFYIPPQGFDPLELSKMLSQCEVNALALVPSLLRILINTAGLIGEERLQLKWLEIGSQAMSKKEKIAVRDFFPNARIIQHYGLTEASRTTLLQVDGAEEDTLSSVGRPYGDVQIKINEKGRICIKGSHLASQILTEGEWVPAVNEQGWLETTDLGCLSNGDLYFQGRADNVVNCGGQKLSVETLELAIKQKFLNEIGVNLDEGIVVSRISNKLYGEGFLVSYKSSGSIASIKKLTLESLGDLGINARNAVSYNRIKMIPKTHTGKIQHKKLVSMFSAQELDKEDEIFPVGTPQEMMKVFSCGLGIALEDLNLSNTVFDIGVDSLQSVQLAVRLDSLLGYLPADWRNQTIDSLSKLPKQKAGGMEASIAKNEVNSLSEKAAPLWDGSCDMNPVGISFLALLKEDFNTHDRSFFSQGLFALFAHRFGNWRMGIKNKFLRFPLTIFYRLLRKMAQVLCGIKLDYTVHVGRRVKLEHFGGMILGARKIGDDTIFRQNTTFGIRDVTDLSAKPTIENGVNIGVGVVIVGDITIGRYSVIGPNSVVTENLPPFSIVSTGATIITTTTAEK